MVISAIIVLLTSFNDVKFAGYAKGTLAPCLKIVVVILCFAILILAALIGVVFKTSAQDTKFLT